MEVFFFPFQQTLYEEARMPIETILERYGIVLRRDKNGKQSITDFDELRKQLEQQGADEEQVQVFTLHFY